MVQKLDFLKQLAHGLAVQFGSSCEVVIHDLTKKDLDQSIVYIENGHVSNRHTGDGPSGIVLETLRSDPEKIKDKLSYLTKTEDGRILKSSTLYIRNEKGRIAYIFSMNYDKHFDRVIPTVPQLLVDIGCRLLHPGLHLLPVRRISGLSYD